MLHRFRLLFAVLTTFFLLVACDSQSIQDASSEQQSVKSTEVSQPKNHTETLVETDTKEEEKTTESASEVLTAEAAAPVEEAAPAEESKESEEAEEAGEAEVQPEPEEVVEEQAEVAVQEPAVETIDPVTQLALEKIAAVNGFSVETHSFLYGQTADYIEVEVREKTEDGTSPMVGRYRYLFESEELLFMDYLTGEFISYEAVE